MIEADFALRELVEAIATNDPAAVNRILAGCPQLVTASFRAGATRGAAREFYLEAVAGYIVAGDTALHFAATTYQTEIARKLIAAGADPRARNRHGDEPLHSAASGLPGSRIWNPDAQAATIALLVEAGADPNATTNGGVTPLHRAVRTRCAAAVRALLECGADAKRPNKNGSTPMLLVRQNTGRGGTGSVEAKAQQQEIVRMLEDALEAR